VPVGFESLGLPSTVVRAARSAGLREPTAVQRSAIPPIVAGRDTLVLAETGAGKTAAYVLPMLARIGAHPATRGRPVVRALVLVPTRELAQQSAEVVSKLSRALSIDHVVLSGGSTPVAALERLRRGVDVVIATPGRLEHAMQQGAIPFGRVEFCVIDEIDRMVALGFVDAVERLARALPERRQLVLVGATLPDALEARAVGLLRRPAIVRAAGATTLGTGTRAESATILPRAERFARLEKYLRAAIPSRVLVFARSRASAHALGAGLSEHGLPVEVLAGDRDPRDRRLALERFRTGKAPVLVATDVAARGLDVLDVAHVVQFGLPQTVETYVHRVGRTGRAGARGRAWLLCAADETDALAQLERELGRGLERVV